MLGKKIQNRRYNNVSTSFCYDPQLGRSRMMDDHAPLAFGPGAACVDVVTGAGGMGGLADPAHQSTRERFQQAAYASMGMDRKTFDEMDPVVRMNVIRKAYAGTYAGDPDTFKWAGMAAYALDGVAKGADESRLLDDFPMFGLFGTPRGTDVEGALEKGNVAIFEDVYWQHLAFQQGGMKALENAFADGELSPTQMESWRKIAEAQELRKSGDPEAARKAEELIWQGNTGLLEHEQNEVAQNECYDQNRDTFKWMSANAPLANPIPGGASFQQALGPDADIGDRATRWSWIEGSMIPAWRARDTDHRDEVLEDMKRFQKLELPPGGAPPYAVD